MCYSHNWQNIILETFYSYYFQTFFIIDVFFSLAMKRKISYWTMVENSCDKGSSTYTDGFLYRTANPIPPSAFYQIIFLRHPHQGELPFNIDLSHDVLRNSVSAEVARVDFPAVYTLILIRHTFVGSLANLLTCSGWHKSFNITEQNIKKVRWVK